jgi:hypothetical protein
MKLTFEFGLKWGCLNENPTGEKRVELPRGSTKRTKHSVQLTTAQFFPLSRSAGIAREAGRGLCRVARASRQRDIRIEVAGSRPAEWSRYLPTRLRSRSDHATLRPKLTYESAVARRIAGLAAPLAFRQPVQQTGRFDPRLAHAKGLRPLAGATAQESTSSRSRWRLACSNIGWQSSGTPSAPRERKRDSNLRT